MVSKWNVRGKGFGELLFDFSIACEIIEGNFFESFFQTYLFSKLNARICQVEEDKMAYVIDTLNAFCGSFSQLL